MIDYRSFSLKKLNTPAFSHLKLLLFWPLYGLCFLLLERFVPLTFHPIECALDAKIPFCEWFVPAYYFWFIYQIGMILYLLLTDREGFRLNAWFTILTYSITVCIYVIYPSCQNLRPEVFPRDNLLTRIVAFLYVFDTNTNVCPSIHVLGSMAAMFAGLHDPHMQTIPWRIYWILACVLICLSTVFLKQHSVIDVFAALALAAPAYLLVYRTRLFRKGVH